jgi:tRNA U34 5-methylaminomethyl-2-thiouridine-forming methyltransferase MnmC
MKSKIIVTDDNSKTLLIPELNETYHSTKGALTEALHVFIQEGLEHSNSKNLKIFEMGFGSGLNAILTLSHSLKNKLTVDYHCIEAYPITLEKASELDYLNTIGLMHLENKYSTMHKASHNQKTILSDNFQFTKYISKIQDQTLANNFFDLIYYDAFGPKVQAELWGEEVLGVIKNIMADQSILVTYCAQGAFKRTLRDLGFTVESIPGPPGKREMTRALKGF